MLRTGVRSQIIAGAYLLGVANGLAPNACKSILKYGLWRALANTFDVSLIVVAAALVGFYMAKRVPTRPIDTWDGLIGGIYLLCLAIPHGGASWVALTILALSEGSRQRRSAEAIAAACVFGTIAISEFWTRVVINLFAVPLLSIDATIVASLLRLIEGEGVAQAGNLIDNAKGQSLAVMVPCSSLQQISYGLLCWVMVVRAFRPAWRWVEVPTALVAGIAIIILNVLRMTLMGINHNYYLFFHLNFVGIGAEIYNVLIVLVASGAAWRAISITTDTSPIVSLRQRVRRRDYRTEAR
jgi:hypothetical protein